MNIEMGNIKGVKTECEALDWNTVIHVLSRIAFEIQSTNKSNKVRDLIRLQCFVAVGSYCGLRASDILKLKWSDVIDKKQLCIQEKKTGKVREIDINEKLQQILSSSFLISKDQIDQFIFNGRKGNNAITIQHMNRFIKKSFDELGIESKNISTHTFRKSFGKRVFEINERSENALILLSKIFNHSSISITRRYIGIQQEQIKEIYLSI